MTSAVDHKTYWGVGQSVMWIRTRDHELVAAISGLSETDAMMLALFTNRARLDPRSLSRFAMPNSERDWQGAHQADGRWSDIAKPVMMNPNRALGDLHEKVHNHHVQMTAIRCGETSDRQNLVPPVELHDLEFRFVPDHPIAPVGLWSRSRKNLVWRAPQFLRTDALRAWPARNTRTTAVYGAIRRHLEKIMIAEAPLTKLEARRRCFVDVPNAYPAAFEKAWAKLEPSRKRGRGKHGPRAR